MDAVIAGHILHVEASQSPLASFRDRGVRVPAALTGPSTAVGASVSSGSYARLTGEKAEAGRRGQPSGVLVCLRRRGSQRIAHPGVGSVTRQP